MRRVVVMLCAALMLASVTTVATVTATEERADALAVGADSKGGRFHIWIIASDADILKSGSRLAITTACKAKAGPAGGAICGQMFDRLIKYVDMRRFSNHGVFVEYYPPKLVPRASAYFRVGRW